MILQHPNNMRTVYIALVLFVMQLTNSHAIPNDYPTWYVLQVEDIPQDMHDTDYVHRMRQMLDNWDQSCLGERITPEIRISVVFEWVCTMLHHFSTSPFRVYNKDDADFIFVPTPPFEHRPNYFKDVMPRLFPDRDRYIHVLMLDAHTLAHVEAWENAPEVAQSFMYIMQQNPAYLFKGIWHYQPHDHPQILPMKDHIVSAPFVGQKKLTLGSKRLHTPLDVEALKQRKTITLLGMYQVRNNQREYLYNQCKNASFCMHDDSAFGRTVDQKLKMVDLYGKAWAALMPQGDEPTRQAIWDCLVMDCIPVFPAPAEWMIPYFPYTDVIDYRPLGMYLTHIDEALKGYGPKVDYMAEFQKQFSIDSAIEQIKAIRNVSHVFQYMQEPYYHAIRFSHLSDVHPYDDAYTMLVKTLLRKMCNRGLLTTKRCGRRFFNNTHNGVVLV